MGRIRTIKPEFPQSESVGKLSRDARLLFIQLWTIADDEGRARAASRMLASLLYPYDDDAPKLVDRWLDELELAGMVRRYVVEGNIYLEIVKWLEHQKIDRPSKSRFPAFGEGSEILASPREASATDLGPRTLDLGPRTVDQARKRAARLPEEWHPTPQDQATSEALIGADRVTDELDKFRDYWKAQPGQRGVKLDWDATFRNWIRNARPFGGAARQKGPENGKPKSAIIQAADDLCRKLASFDGPAREPDELRGGESKNPPRLLSYG